MADYHFAYRDSEFPRLARVFEEVWAADVGCHDNEGVLEIHGAALAVGEPTVIEDLQKDIEYVVMRLFDFIEEQDTIGLAADRFGELPPFFITDVTRRRTDETSYGMLLHVFAHIDAHHIVLAIKQTLGQRSPQFRLADASRTKEDERTNRSLGVFEAGPSTDNGVRYCLHCFILSHNAFVQHMIQPEQLLLLAF